MSFLFDRSVDAASYFSVLIPKLFYQIQLSKIVSHSEYLLEDLFKLSYC
jgi:hypothetical protein